VPLRDEVLIISLVFKQRFGHVDNFGVVGQISRSSFIWPSKPATSHTKTLAVRLKNNEHGNQTELNINFENIDYLKIGNDKQRLAYATLTNNKILTVLQQFNPILVGTIPINIDIENSDLDIICYCKNRNEFTNIIKDKFGDAKEFKIRKLDGQEPGAVIVNFKIDCFEIEIFGEGTPTRQQNAYRHMIIESKLLSERDETFRQKIIDLKRQGYKTEPAFGIALGFTGDPYTGLLTFENKWQQE
jgi:hypothetical protein